MVEHCAWENLQSPRLAEHLHVVMVEKVGSILVFRRNSYKNIISYNTKSHFSQLHMECMETMERLFCIMWRWDTAPVQDCGTDSSERWTFM